MLVTCLNCGRVFNKAPSQVVKHPLSFHNLACYWEWHRGENVSHWWEGGPVTVTCAHCGKEVERYKHDAEAREEHFCSPRHRDLYQVGPGNPHWDGGRTVTSGGYVLRKVYGHPNAHWNGNVLEHRLVMEFMLDRFLEPDEVVHHRDGNPRNNMPSNLRLFENQSEHLKHHRQLEADMEDAVNEHFEMMESEVKVDAG